MIIKADTLSGWFNYIRDLNDSYEPDNLGRFTESFWESQLASKEVVLRLLPKDFPLVNVHIFGGWFGILGQLILDSYDGSYNTLPHIYTCDIDPKCEAVINQFFHNPNITAITGDMQDYKYDRYTLYAGYTPRTSADVVINCSTEHVTQEVYDAWFDNIPADTYYIIQGNNLDIPEHCRLSKDMEEFEKMNRCEGVVERVITYCPGPDGMFQRFTIAAVK
jgi:hypothetical protein